MGSQSKPTPRLVIIEGKEKGKIISLKDGTVVLGRSKGDVLIHDPRISRSHIALHFDEKSGQLSYTDLKSLNGTLVNGETAESGELRDGDKLQLGNTLFDCQIAGSGEEATMKATGIELKTKEAHKRSVKEIREAREAKRSDAEQEESELIPLESTHTPSELSQEMHMSSVSEEPSYSATEQGPQSQKSLFRRIPPKVRIGGLIAAILTLAWTMMGPVNEPSSEGLEREVSSIKNLEAQGKFEEAISKAQNISHNFPNRSESHLLLGDLYAAQGRNELSITAYRRAHELKPPQPLVHIRLIKLFLRSGMVKEAEDELKHVDQVIKEGPHSKELFIEAAQIFLEFKELKQPPEKTFILAKALQNNIAPESAVGYKLEAQSLFQQNRPQEAVEALEKALKIEPKDQWLLENIAFARLSQQDVAGAMSAVETWMSIAPNATKPILVMGYLKFNEGKPQEALPFVQKIIQVLSNRPTEPHYAEALHLLGQIYIEGKQPEQAMNYLRQACDLGFQQSCSHQLVKSAVPAAGTAQPSPASLPQNIPPATSPAPVQAPPPETQQPRVTPLTVPPQ